MTTLLTQEGLNKIKQELEERRTTIRQEIAQAIKEAKEQGDLSENAEYASARQRQSENESRIADLEMIVKDAEVATKNVHSQSVQIGSKVSVRSGKNEMVFTIVGMNEVDPSAGKISNESPMGHAFMGKEKGDKVDVHTPNGILKFEILSVE